MGGGISFQHFVAACLKQPLNAAVLCLAVINGLVTDRASKRLSSKELPLPPPKVLGSSVTHFTQLCEGSVGNKHVSFVKDRSLYEEGLKAEYYINKIQDLFYDEVYTTYIEDRRLLDIISQLIGDEITAINSMIINKPPGTIEHSSHQDLMYFPIRPANKIIGVWTAIDPATIDNGCLYVIPGSHKAELLYNHVDVESKNKLLFHGIQREEYIAPKEKWVYIEMEPGDTLIFNPYLVHGSGANNTQYFRKALTCHYVNSMCHYVDVTGTCQEEIKSIVEAEIKRLGGELSFIDLWRVKSKKVRGVKSNL
ncbi:hypothetical protein K1T71_012717 [Dendrolimus kikuchii]|uniref:Uncharacterized protein n=1 Tax=Dendrolimus kikuchii TaxID=765133 RepID=A0ACC1CKK4_9NEOP|nr:hypothetical protein K1T71_012717 [Dendrolimus kikuchii]